MKLIIKFCTVLGAVLLFGHSGCAAKPDVINIGIFFEWPTPNLVGVEKSYQAKMGVELKWKAYETSEDMNYAFAEGKLDIAYSHEMLPFMKAVANGQDLVATAIAVSYPEHNACVIADHADIDREIPEEFTGKRTYYKPGSVADFRMRKMFQSMGVDVKSLKTSPMGDGAHINEAMYEKKADIGCTFGAPVSQMQSYGSLMMDGDEMHLIGLRNFDFVTMSGEFVRKHRQYAEQFLEITEAYNERYRENPGPRKKPIAGSAFLTIMNANRLLKRFEFPDKSQQISDEWLGEGGAVVAYMNELAKFLNESGALETGLADYSEYIDTSLLSSF